MTRGAAISGLAAVLVFIGVRVGVRIGTSDSGSPRFLLLLYEGERYQADESRVLEYAAWAGSLRKRGSLIGAEKLGEGSEILGGVGSTDPSIVPTGFFLIRAKSLQRAAEIARESPHLRYGGWVVVKPIDET